MVKKRSIETINIESIKDTIRSLDKDTLLKLVEVLGELNKAKDKKPAKKTVVKKKPVTQKSKTTTKTAKKRRGRPPGKVKAVAEKKVMAEDFNKDKDLVEEEDLSDDVLNDKESAQEVAPRGRKPKPLNKTKRGDKGSPGRREPFQKIKNRPNLFIERGLDKLHKADTAIDKKLSGGIEPTPRGVRNDLVEVYCSICGKTCIVNSSLVIDEPDGESRYRCDRCIGG